jgi:hypothetical protein
LPTKNCIKNPIEAETKIVKLRKYEDCPTLFNEKKDWSQKSMERRLVALTRLFVEKTRGFGKPT